jgi:periplasmic nitrate reductase NapD
MPISGVVISSLPGDIEEVVRYLHALAGVEVHGSDAVGNIVAVLETATSEAMQDLIDRMGKDERIINVGLTYLNTEDEALQVAEGNKTPLPLGFRGGSGE